MAVFRSDSITREIHGRRNDREYKPPVNQPIAECLQWPTLRTYCKVPILVIVALLCTCNKIVNELTVVIFHHLIFFQERKKHDYWAIWGKRGFEKNFEEPTRGFQDPGLREFW